MASTSWSSVCNGTYPSHRYGEVKQRVELEVLNQRLVSATSSIAFAALARIGCGIYQTVRRVMSTYEAFKLVDQAMTAVERHKCAYYLR